MNVDQEKLFARLEAFRFDEDGADLTFTLRLARENGWSHAYAERVIDEYKKFVYLAVATGHPVTPSDQVDQAWHLHLTYSRSYWQQLCEGMLGQPLHHGPTRGGEDEHNKFVMWYENTLSSYRLVFGEYPPPDVWPDARFRFGDDLHFVRVNAKRNLIVSKRRLRSACVVTLAVIALLSAVLWVLWPTANVVSEAGRSSGWGIPAQVLLATNSVIAQRSADWRNRPQPNRFDRSQSGSRTTSKGIWIGIFFAVLIIVGILAAIFGGTCPQCQRRRALKQTGSEKKEKGWFKTTEQEWRCKYCGYSEWKKKESGGGGCGGCGGCGG